MNENINNSNFQNQENAPINQNQDSSQQTNQAPPQQGAYNYNQPFMPPPPRQPRNLWFLIPVSLAIGCLPWFILFLIAMVAMIGGAGEEVTKEHVALIRVTGTITGGQASSGVFDESVAGAETIVKQLEEAKKNNKAKAIVLRINSPGGSAAGSEEVYKEIMKIRKSGKPVYASMGDVAASGGYYIASACDKIYSDASTVTGSIGVIFQTADLSQLFNKIGLNPETIKSGKFKDIGSPNRPLSPDERQLLQNMVNDIYNQFVQAVSNGRNMPVEKVKQLADGRIFTGNQALKLGLVDKIAGLRETIRDAAKAGGIKGEPHIKEYGEAGLLKMLLGGGEVSCGGIAKEIRRGLIRDMLGGEGDISGLR